MFIIVFVGGVKLLRDESVSLSCQLIEQNEIFQTICFVFLLSNKIKLMLIVV